jgi:hypothetical protein
MNGSTLKRPSEIVEKVTCNRCGHHFGVIRSDGTGPIFDGCQAGNDQSRLWPEVEAAIAAGDYETAEKYRQIRLKKLSPDAKNEFECPMKAKLEPYQPKSTPLGLGVGNGINGYDRDAGGYHTVAMRALEDGHG